LQTRFGREVIVCRDLPAFLGNRVGFKVLNEVAQLAEQFGVAQMDYLIGGHTGRAMAPLATIDLVGLDVHRAIVDNVYQHLSDEAHAQFLLPTYMAKLISAGNLGQKSGAGFYNTKDKTVLDPRTGAYVSLQPVKKVPFVEKMRQLHRVGAYREALATLVKAEGDEAQLVRRVVFGYVSYALNRVGEGEVVAATRDVDRIMAFGFNWAPPSVIVDLVGLEQTLKTLEACSLAVPRMLRSIKGDQKLFREPEVNIGRFFTA
jgi:3-hydroxyacyl-CoA dehydrogenase